MLALACGGRTSGGSGGDEDGTSTAPGDTGESDSEESGDESGGPNCEEFQTQDPEGPPTEIVIVNDGDEPIFASSPGQCELGYFRMESDTGFYADTGGCTQQCDAEGCGECPPVCVEPFVIRIEPGGRFTIEWDGRYYKAATQPVECAKHESCSGACSVLEPAPPGEYTFMVAAYDSDICGGDVCDCMPGPDGWCETTASSDLPADYEKTALIELPVEGSIELSLP